ncbi:hypothetical protein AYI69_g3617 [Smittium culicis]|uniref:Uncharacterized protein n=1 Tax=Smittium culicis TaxID=133412 RepID=A0A1R1YJ97_9FUNG|nr:hypothetical protein AYI69_g3617 [Smittium culicis]
MHQEILNSLTVREKSSFQPESATIKGSMNMDLPVSHITEKPKTDELELYKILQEALSTVTEDFFKSPLSEINRKKFIAAVPRSSAINYDTHAYNVKLSCTAWRTDTNMYYVPVSKDTEFSNSIRVLLVDAATYLSQCRINQAYRDTGFETDMSQIYPETKKFVDTSQIVEVKNPESIPRPHRNTEKPAATDPRDTAEAALDPEYSRQTEALSEGMEETYRSPMGTPGDQ